MPGRERRCRRTPGGQIECGLTPRRRVEGAVGPASPLGAEKERAPPPRPPRDSRRAAGGRRPGPHGGLRTPTSASEPVSGFPATFLSLGQAHAPLSTEGLRGEPASALLSLAGRPGRPAAAARIPGVSLAFLARFGRPSPRGGPRPVPRSAPIPAPGSPRGWGAVSFWPTARVLAAIPGQRSEPGFGPESVFAGAHRGWFRFASLVLISGMGFGLGFGGAEQDLLFSFLFLVCACFP